MSRVVAWDGVQDCVDGDGFVDVDSDGDVKAAVVAVAVAVNDWVNDHVKRPIWLGTRSRGVTWHLVELVTFDGELKPFEATP